MSIEGRIVVPEVFSEPDPEHFEQARDATLTLVAALDAFASGSGLEVCDEDDPLAGEAQLVADVIGVYLQWRMAVGNDILKRLRDFDLSGAFLRDEPAQASYTESLGEFAAMGILLILDQGGFRSMLTGPVADDDYFWERVQKLSRDELLQYVKLGEFRWGHLADGFPLDPQELVKIHMEFDALVRLPSVTAAELKTLQAIAALQEEGKDWPIAKAIRKRADCTFTSASRKLAKQRLIETRSGSQGYRLTPRGRAVLKAGTP